MLAESLSAALVAAADHRRDAEHPLTIHDLGAGTGSMMRWLAPRLVGPQRWLLHDTDASLLARATAGSDSTPIRALDGAAVRAHAVRSDITLAEPRAIHGADLITASALLDLLTGSELRRIVQACAAVGCPVLLAVNVTGRVDLTPPDPLDNELRRAFNRHQRRLVGSGRLLGPDAPRIASAAFRRQGATVHQAASPWRLTAADSALATAWLEGWVAPAVEVRPELADASRDYLRRRRQQAGAGGLSVTVHHVDLLILPLGAR